MKKLLIPGIAAIALLCCPHTNAQTVVRETTTTAAAEPAEIAGTITEYSPNEVIIRQQNVAAPVRYSFAKTVTYVDEAGNPVSQEIVKSGIPVTVRYIKEGDRMLVNRVIVHKAVVPDAAVTTEKTTTTTTTTTDGPHQRHLEKKLEKDQEKVDRDQQKLDK